MQQFLETDTLVPNNAETTVFTLTLPEGTHSLTYGIAFQPAEALASYHKGWMWIFGEEKQLIVSNLTLPRDWPTSKEITTEVISDGSTPILIKCLVDAAHPVELMHGHTVTDDTGVTQTQGCFWNVAM